MREIRLEVNVSAYHRTDRPQQFTDQEIADAVKKLINHEIEYDDPIIVSIDADSVKVVAK